MSQLYDIFSRCGAVSTDSRNVATGSLFFALKGESFDGNKYALSALEKGAAYVVIDNEESAKQSIEGCGLKYEDCIDRIVECDDTLVALQCLAAEHRKQLGIPILAITGSNGKTTTKELLSRVLAKQYNIATTKGNLNNHIGVPLTLLAMNRNVEFGVVEMGASSCGEIALLCAIAQPDFGVITNIGRAHLEGFGGIEGVKRGKGELCDYLDEHSGVFFYLEESDALCDIVAKHPNMESHPFRSDLANGIKCNLEGDYNRFNIAAAVAIGHYFDVAQHDIAEAIKSYIPDNNRSQRMEGVHNSLIVDCYNANPSSVAAAVDNFSQVVGVVRDKCVILGDMLELGEYTESEHETVVRRLATLGFDCSFLVGKHYCDALSRLCNDNAFSNIHSFETREKLMSYLHENPLTEHFILIKGSRGIGLEKIVELL